MAGDVVSVCRQPIKLVFSLFTRTSSPSGKPALVIQVPILCVVNELLIILSALLITATYHHMIISGDFHFLESSYPVDKGHRGELVTRIMPPVYTCTMFKYHMIGTDMGRLDVYVEEVNRERRLLWSVAGQQSSRAWKKAAIPVQVDTAFKVKCLHESEL